MGDHSAPSSFWAKVRAYVAEAPAGVSWVVTHRRKIASVIVVALPLVSRVLPAFPTADILAFLKMYFGA